MKQSSNAVVPKTGKSTLELIEEKSKLKELHIESKSSSQRDICNEIQ